MPPNLAYNLLTNLMTVKKENNINDIVIKSEIININKSKKRSKNDKLIEI